MSVVELHLIDVDPVLAFIAKACRAEAWAQQLTTEQAAALPDCAVAAFLLLQHAVRDLAGAGIPTMAAVLREARGDAETGSGRDAPERPVVAPPATRALP